MKQILESVLETAILSMNYIKNQFFSYSSISFVQYVKLQLLLYLYYS